MDMRNSGWIFLLCIWIQKQHNKAQVHVYYGDYEAAVGIDGELLAGALPQKN